MNSLNVLSLVLLFLMNYQISFCMKPTRIPVDKNNNNSIAKSKKARAKKNAHNKQDKEIARILVDLDKIKVPKQSK